MLVEGWCSVGTATQRFRSGKTCSAPVLPTLCQARDGTSGGHTTSIEHERGAYQCRCRGPRATSRGVDRDHRQQQGCRRKFADESGSSALIKRRGGVRETSPCCGENRTAEQQRTSQLLRGVHIVTCPCTILPSWSTLGAGAGPEAPAAPP
jgi:hypothetical protein